MKRIAIAGLLSAMALACVSTASRPSNVAAADVDVRVTAPLFFGSTNVSSLAADVIITNRANVPVVVRSIRLSSPGMVEYAIRPGERILNETLAPRETKAFPVLATAVAGSRGLDPREPLSLRAEIKYEAEGSIYKELYNFRNVRLP